MSKLQFFNYLHRERYHAGNKRNQLLSAYEQRAAQSTAFCVMPNVGASIWDDKGTSNAACQ
jgi:hypothetical protein